MTHREEDTGVFSRIQAFDRSIFPTSQGATLFRREQAGNALARFRANVIGRLNSGVDLGAALAQALGDPESQEVLHQPDFPKSAQELIDLLTPPGDEFIGLAPGASAMSKRTGEIGAQAPSKPPEPSAAEKLTQAILAAKTPEEKAILIAQLPRDPSGRLNVADFITALTGGAEVPVNLRPPALKGMTKQQAVAAKTIGESPRAPNAIDLISRGLGLTTGTSLDAMEPTTARGAAIISQNLRQTESQSTIDAILAASPGTRGMVKERESVEELFERFDAGELKAPGARASRQPEVPVAGGKGGQATAPAFQLSPELLTALQALPPENFAELSDETLAQIKLGLQTGQLQLTDEQRAALMAVLQAKQGAGNAGPQ